MASAVHEWRRYYIMKWHWPCLLSGNVTWAHSISLKRGQQWPVLVCTTDTNSWYADVHCAGLFIVRQAPPSSPYPATSNYIATRVYQRLFPALHRECQRLSVTCYAIIYSSGSRRQGKCVGLPCLRCLKWQSIAVFRKTRTIEKFDNQTFRLTSLVVQQQCLWLKNCQQNKNLFPMESE